ncbi:MAG: hypothetical protein D6785_04355, partial [Planctomycetota bacterium]
NPKLKDFFQSKGFLLEEEIGQGATGHVYRAFHQKRQQKFAIKIIHPQVASYPTFRSRFLREMEILTKLDHPNIVRSYYYGLEKDFAYIIMEFVEGESVESRLEKIHVFPIREALHIVLEVAKALQYGYSKGLVHRDIKPANILLTKDGGVKLVDFGLVKGVEQDDQGLTSTGAILGTPFYISPEQAYSSSKVDIRSDIYSLGITLFHMITGNPPFVYESSLRIITAHCYNPLPPLSKFMDKVPAGVEEVLIKMTHKNKEERYQSPEELIKDLESLLNKKWEEGSLKKSPSLSENSDFVSSTVMENTQGLTHSMTSTTLHGYTIRRRLLKLGEKLVKMGLATSEQIAQLIETETDEEMEIVSFPQFLLDHGIGTEEEIARFFSEVYHLPLVLPDQIPIPEEVLQGIPQEICEKNMTIPIQEDDQSILI